LRPGNVELVEVVASMVLATGMLVAVVTTDERRLRGRELERAWPPSSRDAAFFGAWAMGWPAACLVLVVHFVRTRWSPYGACLGLVWAVALYVAAGEAPVWVVPTVIEWLNL
jgi:hypothetical protein